jgi:hypothetical protein
MSGDDIKCSFCEKSKREVKKLIAAKGVFICDECIGLCNEILKEEALKEDKLKRMWDQQESFMRLLQEKRNFPQFPTDITSKKGQLFLKDIRNHLMEELFEAGQHLKNSKSHRATDLPDIDREAYKEELVDALHLYFELIIASGVTLDELFDAYMKKGDVNFERIKGGY